MALVTRKKPLQPPLLSVDEAPAARADATRPARRRQVQTVLFWPEVAATQDALERIRTLAILHASAGQAIQATLAGLLESFRTHPAPSIGFGETAVLPMDDLPADIRVVYQYTGNRLVIVGVRRPDQPSLFGVHP